MPRLGTQRFAGQWEEKPHTRGDILPDGWVTYKRTYRCNAMDRCGGSSDDRDYQLCPCEVVAKSVKVGGKWRVKIMRVCWHNHPLDDLPSDGNRAGTAAKRRKIDGGSEAPAKSRCLHAQMTEHASCGVNTNEAGTPVTMLPRRRTQQPSQLSGAKCRSIFRPGYGSRKCVLQGHPRSVDGNFS